MPPETLPADKIILTPGDKVTPSNDNHALFGKVLTFLEEAGDKIKVELKDEIHTIEAWFSRSEVAKITPTPATAPVAPTPAPVEPTPATAPAVEAPKGGS